MRVAAKIELTAEFRGLTSHTNCRSLEVSFGCPGAIPFEAKYEGKESGALHAALDTKIALDEAQLEIIDAPMGPFRNAEQTLLLSATTDRAEGSGYGLSLCAKGAKGTG
ncbi:MAG: hypothetical protein ACRED0_09215 [Gammaproteobacteria bacterium]